MNQPGQATPDYTLLIKIRFDELQRLAWSLGSGIDSLETNALRQQSEAARLSRIGLLRQEISSLIEQNHGVVATYCTGSDRYPHRVVRVAPSGDKVWTRELYNNNEACFTWCRTSGTYIESGHGGGSLVLGRSPTLTSYARQ